MEKNNVAINSCEEKLRQLENEYNEALQILDVNQLSLLRQKIKQLNEKLRTERRFN